MKSILIFSQHFFPSIGGVEVASALMADVLTEQGNSVRVVTSTPDPDGKTPSKPYEVLRRRSWGQLLRLLRDTDLVIVQGGVSKKMLALCLLTRTPFICVHQMADRPKFSLRSPKKVLDSVLFSFATKVAEANIGVSKQVLIEKLLDDKATSRVLYNPVSDELWDEQTLPLSQRTTDVLFVGRMISGKGVWLLCEALKKIDRKLVCAFVGDGPERVELEKELVFNSQHQVTFHGFMQGAPLKECYRRARVLVVPSTTHPEGMGIVVAEAISNGTPVLVSNQKVLIETAANCGLALTAVSSDELHDKIGELLNVEDTWNFYHENCLERRPSYSKSTFATELEDLLSR